tara:strand:+ start:637 stop:1374 length:738 start_codon:yes stop_codon:yes gene_type:complete
MPNLKKKIYKSALIVIGNEILSGRTEDKNIGYVAKRLSEVGIRLSEVRIVPDIKEEIISSVTHCSNLYDYVFTTGGIGPTHDDITSESVSAAFGLKNILNEEAYKLLLNHYGDKKKINESRIRMAYMPEGCSLIKNSVSKAPGFKINNVMVLAGVPLVMQAMFESALSKLPAGLPVKSIEIDAKLPEGAIAEGLEKIQNKFSDVEIGSYPYYTEGKAGTVLVLSSVEGLQLEKAVKDVKLLIETS